MNKFCIECGVSFEPNSNAQKYCESCRLAVRRERDRLRKQRQRKRWGYRRKKILGTRDFPMHRLNNHNDEAIAVHRELLSVNPNVRRLSMKKASPKKVLACGY